MKNRKKTQGKSLSTLILALMVSGKGVQAQNAVTLKAKFREQETVKYSLRVSVSNPEYTAVAEAKLIELTRRLLPGDAASLYSELKDTKAQLGEGFNLDLRSYKEAFQGWDWVCTARGRVRDATVRLSFPEVRGSQQQSQRLKQKLQTYYLPRMNVVLQIFRPLLPVKPIQVGDTYQAEFGGQTEGKEALPIMHITVVGVETQGERTVCRLKMMADVLTDKGKAHYEAEGAVELSTGRYTRLTGSLTGGQFGKTLLKISLAEIPGVTRKSAQRTP